MTLILDAQDEWNWFNDALKVLFPKSVISYISSVSEFVVTDIAALHKIMFKSHIKLRKSPVPSVGFYSSRKI